MRQIVICLYEVGGMTFILHNLYFKIQGRIVICLYVILASLREILLKTLRNIAHIFCVLCV